MKILPIHLVFVGLMVSAVGQDRAGSQAKATDVEWRLEIPGLISDGKPAPPPPPPVMPDFSVEGSRTFRKDVVEAPPMPGLPAVEGRISVTVRKVIDPGLPELPKPLPPLQPTDPAVIARLAEYAGKYRGTELLFVSATVYDHSRTFLRIYPNGRVKDEVTAWSNLDMNHFSGWGSYRAIGPNGEIKEFMLLMGIGNEDTGGMEKLFSKHGHTYEKPEIPRMRDVSAGPAYVIVDGKDSGSEALETLAEIHELYSVEGARMERAFHSRVAEEKKLRAYYLANPPEPKDVVMNYWRGKRPETTAGEENQ